jgi:hypothetical protein
MAESQLRLGSANRRPTIPTRNGGGMASVSKEAGAEPDVGGAFPDRVATSRSSKRSDAEWRLDLLSALHAKGLITDEEFEARRSVAR